MPLLPYPCVYNSSSIFGQENNDLRSEICANICLNSGCRDRNECDYGSHAENTHNCVRSSNNGICMNNAGASSPYSSSHHQLMKNQSYETIKNGSDIRPGSFSCGSCSTSGTRRYGSSGTVKRFCLSFV